MSGTRRAIERETEPLPGWAASFAPSLVVGAAAAGLAVAWDVPVGGAAVLGILAFGWARTAWVMGS